MEKRALVSIGENTHVVCFCMSADSGEEDALAQAVQVAFKDILHGDQEFFLQCKDEEWGGAFVDLAGTAQVSDKSVCRVVVK